MLERAEAKWLDTNPEPDKESADWFEWQAAYGGERYDEADATAEVASAKLRAQSTRSATHAPALFEVCLRKPASAKLTRSLWANF